MKSKDVIGKRIVQVDHERMSGDREYYGPRVICVGLTLEDGTRILAHAAETSDMPLAYMDACRDKKTSRQAE